MSPFPGAGSKTPVRFCWLQMATGLVAPSVFVVLTGAVFDRRADLVRQGFSFARARFFRRSELSRGDLKHTSILASTSVLQGTPPATWLLLLETCRPTTSRPNRTLQQTNAGFPSG